MTMYEAHAQQLAAGPSPMAAGHVGSGLRLNDEDLTLGFEIELAVEPVVPVPHDVGPALLDRAPHFFTFDSMPREEAMHGAPRGTPRSARLALNSVGVMPPCPASSTLMKLPCAPTLPECRSLPRGFATALPCWSTRRL